MRVNVQLLVQHGTRQRREENARRSIAETATRKQNQVAKSGSASRPIPSSHLPPSYADCTELGSLPGVRLCQSNAWPRAMPKPKGISPSRKNGPTLNYFVRPS